MLKRKHIFIILTGGIFITSILYFTGITAKKNDSAKGQTVECVEAAYERELFSDTELQQRVRDFSLPANILKLFHEHEERLNIFAEQCYINRVMDDSFFVRYIDSERFYFCSSDIYRSSDVQKDHAIKDGKYDYITSFMDYAVDTGLAYRDWMLDIDMYGRIKTGENNKGENGRYDLELEIRIYNGKGFVVSFCYYSNAEKDYSDQSLKIGMCDDYAASKKCTRINANWYYEYTVMLEKGYWLPEFEDLAFVEGFYSKRETTTIMKRFLTENLRCFLRLYWKYGTDFTRISWRDWEEFRWNEPYNLE